MLHTYLFFFYEKDPIKCLVMKLMTLKKVIHEFTYDTLSDIRVFSRVRIIRAHFEKFS